MASAQEPWWYQPCPSCVQRVIADRQCGWVPTDFASYRVACVDGHDGLCSEHREAREWERQRVEREQRRETRRKAKWMKRWTVAVPEGQE